MPALGIDYGESQVLRFAGCRVQGAIAGDADAPCRGAEPGRSGWVSQSSQEKRVISSASPTNFWEKATAKFRGGGRTCEHVHFPPQSCCESGAGGLGVLLLPGKQILTEAWSVPLLIPCVSENTSLPSTFSSVKWVRGFLSCLSQRDVLNQLMNEGGLWKRA